ncbi:hypothetical protein PAE975_6069 (plasmid) [Pseudomonas aeruginosa]|uniref:hypothetical protein n=1 Tax=Pseudomonas aeruginosa TaxID=287 RepID=UPI001A23D32F|nr:hypothetical protein [Pseudomonas aeruginosa]MBH8699177.1 hypothetical protein [Pseudomonas aeruginosa]HEK3608662.1 hypothetical protein [Pseudomonas aeruginosa]
MPLLPLLVGAGLAYYLGRFKSEWLYTWLGLDSSTDPYRLFAIGFFAVSYLALAVIYKVLPLNELFYRYLPKVWGRWWSARLLATTACSEWLHAGNPDFTTGQRWKRNALCLGLFILPGKLPMSISKQPITKQPQPGALEVKKLTLQPALYRDQSIAIRLFEDNGEPYSVLSTYIEHADIRNDEICIPSWNFKPEVLAGLIATGRFVDTRRVVPTGFVEAPVWRVTCPELLAQVAEQRAQANIKAVADRQD